MSMVEINVGSSIYVNMGVAGDVEVDVDFDYEFDLDDIQDEINEEVEQHPRYYGDKIARVMDYDELKEFLREVRDTNGNVSKEDIVEMVVGLLDIPVIKEEEIPF